MLLNKLAEQPGEAAAIVKALMKFEAGNKSVHRTSVMEQADAVAHCRRPADTGTANAGMARQG
jgi:hypothetical protein